MAEVVTRARGAPSIRSRVTGFVKQAPVPQPLHERAGSARMRSRGAGNRLSTRAKTQFLRGSEATGADHAPQKPDAESAGQRETDHGDDVDSEHVRPSLREDADQARADQAAGHDRGDDEPVEDDVQPVEQVVKTLVDEADLDLAVADLLEEVV